MNDGLRESTQLESDLVSIGFSALNNKDSIGKESIESSTFSNLIEENQAFYQAVVHQRPEKSSPHLLLGLFTKLHIESLGFVQQHTEQMKAMDGVFKANLPEKSARQFHATDVEKLELITKIWLYIQGFNQLDFSLANDHAYETSEIIGQIYPLSRDEKRTEFIAFYYYGIEAREQHFGTKKHSLFQKLLNGLRNALK